MFNLMNLQHFHSKFSHKKAYQNCIDSYIDQIIDAVCVINFTEPCFFRKLFTLYFHFEDYIN